MTYALFWKGKRIKEFGVFNKRIEAETTRGIETTQMEFAEFTPIQLRKFLQIRKVKK